MAAAAAAVAVVVTPHVGQCTRRTAEGQVSSEDRGWLLNSELGLLGILITAGNEYSAAGGGGASLMGPYYPLPEPESPPRENRFRRRMAALRDADGRRAHATRSQSNDHLFMLSRGFAMPGDDLEPVEPMPINSSRYTTPEIGLGGYNGGGPVPPSPQQTSAPDYAYVAYHDSGMPGAGLRGSLARQQQDPLMDLNAAPVRSILKNRQVKKGLGWDRRNLIRRSHFVFPGLRSRAQSLAGPRLASSLHWLLIL
jgi:hypothetical protein